MTTSNGDGRQLARISEQLDDLKRLAILQLLASGMQSAHIAKALGVHQSALSRMLPVRDIQKAAARRNSSGADDG
jgi:IS30 family transposase